MSDYKYKTILNEADTRAKIAAGHTGYQEGRNDFDTASEWLADLLDEREKTDGFQYNTAFLRWLEKREGWPASGENGSTLSTLVYTSQGYRQTRAKLRAGFAPITDAMIRQAAEAGQRLLVLTESVFGEGEVEARPKVLADGRAVAYNGRSRSRGWTGSSMVWAKIKEAA